MRIAAGMFLGLVLIATAEAGGDGKPKDLIIGKWAEKAEDFTIAFHKDGKVTMSHKDKKIEGTYKFLDDKTFELEAKFGDDTKKIKLTVEKISKEQMTVSKDDSKDKKELIRVK